MNSLAEYFLANELDHRDIANIELEHGEAGAKHWDVVDREVMNSESARVLVPLGAGTYSFNVEGENE